MLNTHRIPTHLDQEDTLLWNFSTRQVLIMAVGLIFGFIISNNLVPILGPFAHIALVIMAILSITVALVQIKKRPLDQWLFIWLIYYLQPHYYIWQAHPEELPIKEEQEQYSRKEEIEEW